MRPTRPPMTALRQRMHDNLQLRNYSPPTVECYLRCVAPFAQHFRTSPERLGPEPVRPYHLYLVQPKHVSWSLVMQTGCALRFFGYLLKAGQLEYDCRYSKMHGMPVTGGRGFRGLKPLWYNGVPP